MADQQDAKTGRPSIRTDEVVQEILARMAGGDSLRRACFEERMPAPSTFLLWVSQDKALSEQYDRVREVRADGMFEEMLDIADDGTNDWMLRGRGENDPGWVANGENIQRSRLRVDTRKWALARMNPKKYGEKITNEVVGKDGGPITTATIDTKKLTKEQLAALATIRIPTDPR